MFVMKHRKFPFYLTWEASDDVFEAYKETIIMELKDNGLKNFDIGWTKGNVHADSEETVENPKVPGNVTSTRKKVKTKMEKKPVNPMGLPKEPVVGESKTKEEPSRKVKGKVKDVIERKNLESKSSVGENQPESVNKSRPKSHISRTKKRKLFNNQKS